MIGLTAMMNVRCGGHENLSASISRDSSQRRRASQVDVCLMNESTQFQILTSHLEPKITDRMYPFEKPDALQAHQVNNTEK